MQRYFSVTKGFLVEGVNIPIGYEPLQGEISISELQHTEFSGLAPSGKRVGVSEARLSWVDLTPPDLTEVEMSVQVRAKRDALIDRVTREINRLEDVGDDASQWRSYRVSLRNLPEQAGFPSNVDWPTQPGSFTGK
ncbi:hypothetical protein KCG43_11145 [Photobacterium sp. WH24]|uniref:phage tail assembly chaperone n=1 Tax=Photobacterium sp. WH24 TaxID=2827237 RepID=UPI001C47AEF2|nr:phage tail assembly chaperone [Photobacterium sp. WH24]MBV7262551.1 hypothetical protein [Photobacterium sp. WH24]